MAEIVDNLICEVVSAAGNVCRPEIHFVASSARPEVCNKQTILMANQK